MATLLHNNSTKSEIVTIFVASAPIIFEWTEKGEPTGVSLSVALMTFVIGSFVSAVFSRREAEIRQSELVDRIRITIKSSVHLETVGRGPIARDVFARLIPDADEVSNTYINSMRFIEVAYDAQTDRISEAYRKMLEDDSVRWTDVVGGPLDNYIKRFSSINPDNVRANFRVYEVDEHPTVNFVIIRYRSTGISEVFFGWELHEHERDSEVFRSTDDRLIGNFRNLFSALHAGKKSISIKELLFSYINKAI